MSKRERFADDRRFMQIVESQAGRLARLADDRRFMRIVEIAVAFAELGVRIYVYALDDDGVIHRLDARTANSVCGARISQEAKIQFYVHATCVRCVSAT